jgi:hypothetical protein
VLIEVGWGRAAGRRDKVRGGEREGEGDARGCELATWAQGLGRLEKTHPGGQRTCGGCVGGWATCPRRDVRDMLQASARGACSWGARVGERRGRDALAAARTVAARAGALGLVGEGAVAGLQVGHAERGALGWVAAPREWPSGPRRQGHGVSCASAREWAGHAARWVGGGGGREGELGLFYFLLLIIFFYSYSYLYTRKSYKLNGYTPRQYVKHKVNALQHDATIRALIGF